MAQLMATVDAQTELKKAWLEPNQLMDLAQVARRVREMNSRVDFDEETAGVVVSLMPLARAETGDQQAYINTLAELVVQGF